MENCDKTHFLSYSSAPGEIFPLGLCWMLGLDKTPLIYGEVLFGAEIFFLKSSSGVLEMGKDSGVS
ncbi:conserved hypothetical protein [Ricinus communis]|uniref:Uncharacterized protein n=1 Tax=Ricinus communis TaxID=3988 RepID=B9RHK5_RICCO|nr:conserved hypothetical protein [Ricinus communis]